MPTISTAQPLSSGLQLRSRGWGRVSCREVGRGGRRNEALVTSSTITPELLRGRIREGESRGVNDDHLDRLHGVRRGSDEGGSNEADERGSDAMKQ